MNRERAVELSSFAELARANGWSIDPATIKNVRDGAERAMLERFPNATAEDVTPVVTLMRDQACAALDATGGKWPSGKGSFYEHAIDRLLTTDNHLFTAALLKN